MKTVACLRVSTAQQDVRSQRLAILDALAKARSSGRKLGRPKGSLGVSRLNRKEDDIRRFLHLGVSKTAIAKLTGGPYHPLQLHEHPRAQAQPLACIAARIWSVPEFDPLVLDQPQPTNTTRDEPFGL